MEKKPFQGEYIAKLKETPVKLYMAYQKPYMHTYTLLSIPKKGFSASI